MLVSEELFPLPTVIPLTNISPLLVILPVTFKTVPSNVKLADPAAILEAFL